jgi:hypothetical protein
MDVFQPINEKRIMELHQYFAAFNKLMNIGINH